MTKSFKDFLMQDVRNTFINLNEFAEKVTINGVEADVVIENDGTLKKSATVGNRLNIEDRLGNGNVVFSIAKSFFTHIPQVERPMDFNGTKFKIINVNDDLGMLTITLTRYLG